MPDFVHLHLHSEYSLLDGACRITDIPGKAKEMGHSAVAITDHGVLYGAVAFYKACKDQGIQPIIGCEVYVARRSMQDRDRERDGKSYHLVLLVENETGYRNLIWLVSKAYTDGFYTKPRIDLELLQGHTEGLIALSACLAGYIPQNILAGEYAKAEEHARFMQTLFGKDHYYLEIQNHGLDDDKVVCEGIRELSEKTGIPMVATNDVHYLNRQDADTQAILMCVQTGNVITDGRPIGFETNEFYYKSTAEMEALFSAFPGAIENTAKIAERCRFDYTFGEIQLPRYTPENGMKPTEYLRSLAIAGLERKLASGAVVPDEKYSVETYRERIDYELSVIHQMGYSEYYLVVWDFVNHAKEEGIPVGPGRGSGAGSLVAYLIGITDIDSLKFDLLFERFLNPERVSMPDFDIDFCYDRRDEAIAYVREKYGEDHTAQIITFGTLAARAAVKDVGRAMGMSIPDVDNVAKKIPRELGITLDKAIEANRELRDLYEEDPQVKKLLDTAKALEGMPRHASTHAAGVVITEHPLTEYVPIAVNSGVTVTQFDMDTIAELGLLKFDFLALRYLTILRSAEDLIRETEPDFDLTRVDMGDPKTYDTISAGKTDGVFQLESEGMRQMLTQLKPRCLDDIIAAIALYRPGPMDSIPKYIEARRHTEAIQYASPALAPILDVTYGCIVYQEQVMQIFREIAGYTFGHADVVRRAISKKKQGVLEKEREAFLTGAVKNGMREEDASDLFEDIVSFANYAFNKSHAAAYAVLSYRTAYLRTHYPLEYNCALLTSVLSQTGKLNEYITECAHRGIKVLPPDINRSRAHFHVEGNCIRFGLVAVKNVGLSFINAVVQERVNHGDFRDFADFVERMYPIELNKRQVEFLIKSGAMDALGAFRSQLLTVYESVLDSHAQAAGKSAAGQIGMFDDSAERAPEIRTVIEYPQIPEFTTREKLSLEKESCGFYLSGHILDDYSEQLASIQTDQAGYILRAFGDSDDGDGTYSDKMTVTLAGCVTKRTNKITKNGDPMAFVNLDDGTGEIELVCFPKKLAEWGHLLQYDAAVIVKGTISARDDEDIKILANQVTPMTANDHFTTKKPESLLDGNIMIQPLPNAPEPLPPADQSAELQNPVQPARPKNPRIFMRVDSKDCENSRRIRAFCRIFPGTVPVLLYYKDTGTYEKEIIPCTYLSDFTIRELQEIAGEKDFVFR